MTDQQHPITPPPELVEQWTTANGTFYKDLSVFSQYIATQAAQWGADTELEACCKWLDTQIGAISPTDLRAVRRPKPLSLKEQVLKMLDPIYEGISIQLTSDEQKLIVKTLESLPD